MSTVTPEAFTASAEYIRRNYKVTYKLGYRGTKYCDCRGYILWALSRLGIDVSSTGTNYMSRNQMRSIKPISKASELEPGMIVFKARSKSDSKWSLPSRYRSGTGYSETIGLLDVYHVGIVTSVKPLIIRHCSSGGIRTDSSLGKWNYAGWLKWIEEGASEPEPETVTCTVVARKGNTVRMRKAPGGAVIRTIPVGSVVQAEAESQGYRKIIYKEETGYMMASFLEEVNTDGNG